MSEKFEKLAGQVEAEGCVDRVASVSTGDRMNRHARRRVPGEITITITKAQLMEAYLKTAHFGDDGERLYDFEEMLNNLFPEGTHDAP